MDFKIINETTVELKFYGYITDWWNSADDYKRTIDRIEAAGYKNVIIKTHCYGGSVFEGAAIWATNKSSKLNIEFHIDGIAASMMGVIILSGKKKCQVSQLAKVMVHAPRDNAGGTSGELQQTIKLLKSIEKDFSNEWMSVTGQSKADADKLMDGKDYWFDADELIALGIASNKYGEPATDPGKPDAGTPIDKVFSQFTAALTTTANHSLNNNSDMDKQALIDKFNLTGVTKDSSDTAIMDAINAAMAKKDQRITELESTSKNVIEANANAMIAAKETELKTKFSEEEKKGFVAVAKVSGIETLTAVLGAIKPVPNLTALAGGGQPGNPLDTSTVKSALIKGREDWNFEKWEKEDPTGLQKLSNSTDAEEEAYINKLYAAEFNGAVPVVRK